MTLEAAVEEEEEGTDPLAMGGEEPREDSGPRFHRREFLLGGAGNNRRSGIPRCRGRERNRPPTVGERGGENSAGRGLRLSRAIVLLAETHKPTTAEAVMSIPGPNPGPPGETHPCGPVTSPQLVE